MGYIPLFRRRAR